jgi:two-component system, OmpR family, alkaline phosphatase synthesis response regulator PhoP
VKSILVVEDEYAIAELVSIILEEAGYEVAVAQNGRDGFNYVTQTHPDLVVCDVMMPILDGRQLVRAMQDDATLRAIPVIMMSALPERGQGNGAYAAYVNKPFDPDELVELVTRLIGPPENGTP